MQRVTYWYLLFSILNESKEMKYYYGFDFKFKRFDYCCLLAINMKHVCLTITVYEAEMILVIKTKKLNSYESPEFIFFHRQT